MPSSNIKKIRQKVHRESQQDGIVELLSGSILLYFTVIFDDLVMGTTTHMPVIFFFLFTCMWPVLYLKLIRTTFTYPRMGYVEMPLTVTRSYLYGVILPLVLLPLLTWGAVWLLADFVGLQLLLKCVVVAVGLMFGAIYFSCGRQQGRKIYFLLSALSVSAGAVLPFAGTGERTVTAILAANSVVLLLLGGLMLVRFVIKYPKANRDNMDTNKLGDQ